MIEDFEIVAEAFSIDKDNFNELKKYFKKVLGHGPAEKVRKLMHRSFFNNTVTQGTICEYPFGKMKKAFIKLYYTSTNPKGDMIEYLKSDKCTKPKDKSVSDYQNGMEEIMRYSTYLQGTKDNLSKAEINTILFTSFPVAW